jgi:glyoxylase-like metal-dependent hydrolase (beta-lactamase superfamily II)
MSCNGSQNGRGRYRRSIYGTVFFVGDNGVLIFDTLEGVYDNVTKAVAAVTEKPIVAAVYPHYHADHIGDIAKYVASAKQRGVNLRIIASLKTKQPGRVIVGVRRPLKSVRLAAGTGQRSRVP